MCTVWLEQVQPETCACGMRGLYNVRHAKGQSVIDDWFGKRKRNMTFFSQWLQLSASEEWKYLKAEDQPGSQILQRCFRLRLM